MIKKTIVTSLLSASVFAVITANAVELPDSSLLPTNKNNNNKPIIQAVSMQANNGLLERVYVSGQIGYANTDMKSKLSSESFQGLSNDGLAGRLAIGYKINKNFAVELGYLQLQEGKIKDEDATGFLNQNTFDLTGKALLPITHNVNFYGKLGVAYLTTHLETTQNINGIPTTSDINGPAGIAKRKWAPEVAVGMAYDITPNVTVDTSLTHIQAVGDNRPGNIDFLAVGLTYNFG